jgi:hypothetical protein
MSMILSWALFPLVLAALGLGWGALVEWAGGERELGALAIPLGLAAAIVVAALLTISSATAPAAAPVVAAGGVAGLARAWRRTKLAPAVLVAAAGVLLIYGAPVILSGQATFLGYVRLDDTATWLAFIDQFFAHGRSLATLPTSTYNLLLQTNLTTAGYPAGAFMLPGIGHWITGIDAAWIFQPYLAVCAAALAMCGWELLAPVVPSGWLRAFVAFIAAQSALLFGYAAWGGIKELTAAFLVALGLAVAARAHAAPSPRLRASVPLAVAVAALIVTLGPGAIFYVAPAALAVVVVLVWRWGRTREHALGLLGVVPLTAALVAALVVPSWLTLSNYLRVNGVFTSATADHATAYGNLTSALRAIQLGGIWIDGDFRNLAIPGPPPSFVNHLLVYCVFAGAIFALGWTLWKRSGGLALYVAVALVAVAVLSARGTVPWVMGKSLAISSPAVLLAGMTGGAILFSRERIAAVIAGVLLLGAIAGGVLWSNYLQYHDVTLAPRARLAELQKIGTLIAGKGPTLFNEYEIYGDRHFLRAAAPVEPAEYRPGPQLDLPTLGGALLTDPAWADIDAFALNTLAPFRSLVTRVGPTASRPPSIFREVYAGRYYELWQQPAHPTTRVIEHVGLGDTVTDPYCGNASSPAPHGYLCAIAPATVPSCSKVLALAATAAADHGELVAFARPNPIVVRGTDTQWSSGWDAYTPSGTLTPIAGGASATAHIVIPHGVSGYQLWLGGSFARGFTVSVDGRRIGAIADALDPVGAYERVGSPLTLRPGTHAITITYPNANLSPGNADSEEYTSLSEIALSPPDSQMRLVTVKPALARSLCGRLLDWIEVVTPA